MKEWKKIVGYSATAAIISVMLGAFLLSAWRKESPVVTREIVNATIRSLSSSPHKPNGMGFGTSRYMYMIELGDGQNTAFVWDATARPHRIGSVITVERQTRANGTVSFEVVAQQ
jgi:hypothetical protein